MTVLENRGPGKQHTAHGLACYAKCQQFAYPAHLVGLPRPVGCLQGLVQSLRHQHQEACHTIQRLCAMDFRLCDDGFGLGSTMRESTGKALCGNVPRGTVSAQGKNLHSEQKNI